METSLKIISLIYANEVLVGAHWVFSVIIGDETFVNNGESFFLGGETSTDDIKFAEDNIDKLECYNTVMKGIASTTNILKVISPE